MHAAQAGGMSKEGRLANLAAGRPALSSAPLVVQRAGVAALPLAEEVHRQGRGLFASLKNLVERIAAAVHSQMPGSLQAVGGASSLMVDADLPANTNPQQLICVLHLAGFTLASGGFQCVLYPACLSLAAMVV